jgi:hypothetical protein
MPEPSESPGKAKRSVHQKACMVIVLGLLALAMIFSALVAFLELPPAKWINKAQDKVINGHFPMIGFLVVMIPSVFLALGIGAVIIKAVRRHMAQRGIPWVDDQDNIIP